MSTQAGQRRFREVVLPHLDDGYSLARWLSGADADAEDIVQEAAMRALAALETVAPLKSRAWWLSVVRNTALTWIRRHRPKALAFVGDLDDVDAFEAGDPSPDPEAALIAHDEGERVRRAIAALPSPLRETLVLREIEDMDYKEIAEATQAPIGTVMSRLSRARAALARALGAER